MKKVLILLLAIVSLSSCGSYKRLAYLQDMKPDSVYVVTQVPDTRICRGDELGISVLSSNPLLAAPFNIRPERARMDTLSGAGAKSSDNDETPASKYTVDEKGRINFPVLGPVYAEGLTLNELSTTLVDAIRATNYLKDPVVSVAFENFEVVVLGEITTPKRKNYPTGNVNIFQLLADLGDLTEYAQRDNVWVIRTTGGTRKVFALNLKSKSVYDSPAFYLQQNDMVYAAPLNSKLDSKSKDVLQLITTPLSVISTIFSSMTFFRSISR